MGSVKKGIKKCLKLSLPIIVRVGTISDGLRQRDNGLFNGVDQVSESNTKNLLSKVYFQCCEQLGG